MKVGKQQRLFLAFYEHVETHKNSSHRAHITSFCLQNGWAKTCGMLTILMKKDLLLLIIFLRKVSSFHVQ